MSQIHPRLAEDCLFVGKFPLSYLLLMLDANYPWFILVPNRDAIQEIYQLSQTDQQQLLTESSALGKALMQGFKGDKLNVAALGNVVPQLHLHHIVRYRSDPAWPDPVWGRVPRRDYPAAARERVLATLRQYLVAEIEYQGQD